MTRPSVVPTWAVTLANDPTSNQPNRDEPSAGKKTTGFEYDEEPPRQDLNWLFWIANQWIEYYSERIASGEKLILPTIEPAAALAINTAAGAGTGALNLKGSLSIRSAAGAEVASIENTNGDSYVRNANASGKVITPVIEPAAALAINTAAGAGTGAANLKGSLSIRKSDGSECASIENTNGDVICRRLNLGGVATDITGAELETLSDGSVADAKHKHEKLYDTGHAEISVDAIKRMVAGVYAGMMKYSQTPLANGDIQGYDAGSTSSNITINTTTGIATIQYAGKYEISFAVTCYNNNNTTANCAIAKNGSEILGSGYYKNTGVSDNGWVNLSGVMTLDLGVGDTIRLKATNMHNLINASLSIKQVGSFN